MGRKLKKILRKNRDILKNINPTPTRHNKYLRLFYHFTGKLSVSISYSEDNGVVKFSEVLEERSDRFIHMEDIDKIYLMVEKYNNVNNVNLKGMSDVIQTYRSKGLLIY